MRKLLSITLAAIACHAGGAALAQGTAAANWPERPVTIIVPFAPGGGTDIIGRLVATQLTQALGKPFLIDNRGGAGGNLGTGQAVRAVPDGYTLLMHSSAYFVNPSLYKSVPYNAEKDFVPITELASAPNIFVAHPKANIKSLPDLVVQARKNPGKFNFASAGVGVSTHLDGELLNLREKIDLVHIPYGGAGPAIAAVLAGTPEIGAFFMPPLQPHLKAGTLKPLAITSEKRWYNMPDVPTMVELGYPDFISETVIVFFAPAGTPPDIVRKVEAATIRALQTPEVKLKTEEMGYAILGRGAAALSARTQRELVFYKKLITDAKIPVQ